MQSSSVLPITQRLLILEVRFNLRMKNTDGTDLDDTPLSTDFTLWENVQKGRPEELARSNTESVQRLFSLLLQEDVLRNGPSMQNVREHQSNLCDDVWACLAVDRSHSNYFMKLAEVC
jgi:urate oxidase